MKKLIAMTTLILFTGCGKDVSLVETFKAQDFEGFYYCDNNSTLELISDFSNRVTFESSGQSLNSVNPKNDSLGTHPTISDRDLIAVNNKLVMSPRNYNYNSSTHDLETDVRGSNITGNRRTDISLKLLTEHEIELTIDIFEGPVNGNVNSIVAKRLFNCKK